jgi:putative ABC transport system permease protein
MASWYQQEMRMAKILKLVTGISILISCLGLLGMVVLETNNRIKEIGVRQVLGASKANLFTLLSKNFFFLILGSVFISFPLAWWFISDWLDNYAYPIAVTWWMFVLPGCLLIVVALITVLAQVLKAALTNPVESLRNE